MTSKFVSLEEASAFLSERYGADVADVAELGEGYWSRAFSFRRQGRELVARFGQHREDFDKDRAAMAFDGPDAPVPEVLEVGEALGGAYAISERKHGEFLERLGTGEFHAVLPALLRALDRFRNIPLSPGTPIDIVAGPSATTRDSTWDSTWGEWLLLALEDVPGGRVSGWRAKMRETPDIDELFEHGGRELTRMAADCPDIRHVLHCDLINRNVLVAPDGSKIEAILDWGCSIYGDFLYEIAGLTFWESWYPGIEAAGLTSAIPRHYREIGLDVPDFELRLRCCELQIGLLHLAYSTFVGDGHIDWIAERTRRVLEGA